MKHLDVTIDFETCALTANAAVMQMGAVAWNREAFAYEPLGSDVAVSPFLLYDKKDKPLNATSKEDMTPEIQFFEQSFDLREQFMLGRDFSQSTIEWWKKQDAAVKDGILDLEPMRAGDVLRNFTCWLEDLIQSTGADSLSLWAQGTDFDVAILDTLACDTFENIPDLNLAILRSLCQQCNIKMPMVKYQNFRDARTYIMEQGSELFLDDALLALREPKAVYDAIREKCGDVPAGQFGGKAHNAVYDSLRSSWNVYQCMKAYWKE